MQRFFTLIVLFLVSLPVGISISGCEGSNVDANFCNGKGYGQKLGQVDKITLEPAFNGISLSYGQTSTVTTPAIYALGTVTTVVSFAVMGGTLALMKFLGRRKAGARAAG